VTEKSRARDWVADRRSYLVAWGIPSVALAAGALLAPPARTIVWAVALTWMGTACIVNALRCRRLHCYLTGPFFLLMAAATLGHGFRVLWLGAHGWLWLATVLIFVGGGLLWYLPERVFGKYAS
jgi:hypothetical protein